MDTSIDGLSEVNLALDGLIAALSPAGRRKLGLRVGQLARRENDRRIGRNVSPDGTAHEPRLRQKGKKAKKGKMFKKLRQAARMRIVREADGVTVRFRHGDDRIAQVHHFGLRDKLFKSAGKSKSGKIKEHKYAERPLLGFARADLAAMEDLIYAHVAQALR